MKMKSITSCLALFLAATVSCREQSEIQVEVRPLPADLQSIDISYIPWGYVDQGSGMRARYLQYELAAVGVASTVVTAANCSIPNADYAGTIRLPNGKTSVHYTSAVVSRPEGTRIIDPLLSPDFLTDEQWREQIHATTAVNIAYNTTHPSANQGVCGQSSDADKIPQTLADMPPFSLANLMIHCSYFRGYLADLSSNSVAADTKLVARTSELVLALRHANLLDEAFDSAGTLPHLAQGPWCPPPTPKN